MKVNVNLQKAFQASDKNHVFLVDENSRILGANNLQIKTSQALYGVSNEKDIIGCTIAEIYREDKNKAQLICLENEEVLRTGIPKHFYSTLIVPNQVKIQLSTMKIPVYDLKGNIHGVFGIAQYQSKFYIEKILEYSLTPRETDCLEQLLMEKTALQIAFNLKLSRRTVESYLESVKLKFSCINKTELLIKAKNMGLYEIYRDNTPLSP